MKLTQIYNNKDFIISFEVFPPKGDDVNQKIDLLIDELSVLSKFNPAFISVTYGAGGNTHERSFNISLKIKNELKINVVSHFTCVGAVKEDILTQIKYLENNGIRNILALRGDPPKGETKFIKPSGGFGYANELVEFIKKNTDLSIAVAGYPECHPECENLEKDIMNLKRKIDLGGDVVITQVFYNNDVFFNFIEKTQKTGVNIPIIPGILPITSYAQIERMIELSGTKVPDKFKNKLEKYKDDKTATQEIGINYAIEQCEELINNQVKGIHFYTLNKAFATEKVLDNLSIPQLLI
ncbi:MAG: methylenetetrahydrofolate reductase [NAD(P)H] [Candidatus Gastranaerophilales bacterium]|nr:methylenetetrahydrofolate reductase [NAD(P)H] [Candidatus Gastranaerophilales bacterium]